MLNIKRGDKKEIEEVEGVDVDPDENLELMITQSTKESERIIKIARKHNTILRLVGGLAIHAYCTDHAFCDRHHGDMDLVGLKSQYESIVQVMKEAGYVENTNMTISTGGSRLLFHKQDGEDHIDVFLDQINIEHEIDFRDRLEIEEETVSVSDLLLIKLTITKLNEKDIRDIISIVKDLQMGHNDSPRTINMNYIADLCAKSWGLHHDVSSSLRKTLQFLPEYHLPKKVRTGVIRKLEELQEMILKSPKSIKWRLRALLGEHIPWRREIETTGVTPEPVEVAMKSHDAVKDQN